MGFILYPLPHVLAFIVFTPPVSSLVPSAHLYISMVIFLLPNSPLLFFCPYYFNLDSDYEGKHTQCLFLSLLEAVFARSQAT